MKKLTTILLSFIILSACKETGSKTDKDALRKIASIKTVIYTIENADIKNQTLYGYELLTFDKNELEKTKHHYSKDSTLILKESYSHFKEKNLVHIRTTTEDDQLISKDELHYQNGLKKIKEKYRFNQSNELVLKDIFIWDDTSKKIEQTRSINNEIYSHSFSIFDEYDNFISQRVENKKENFVSNYDWKYLKFDNHNQWLERQEFLDGRLVKVEKREIVYY